MMDQQLPLSKDWKGPELLKLTEEELIERLLQVVESVNTATAPDRNGLTWAERIDGAFEKAFGSHPKDWGARGRLPNDVLFEGALQSQSDPRFERRLIENMIRDRPVGVSVDMGRVRVLQGQAYLLPVNTRSREELHAMVLVGLEHQGSEVKSVILRNSWGSDRHVGSGDFRISWHDFWQVNAGYFTFLSDLGDDHGSRLATLQLLMETRPRSPSPVEFLATHWSLDPFESVQVLEWLNRAEDLASWATFVSKQSSEWKRELLKTGYLYDEREFRRVRRILVEADQDPRSFFEKALGQELREWLSVMHRHLQAPRCPVAPFLRLVH
jgi:hypothetical protein